MSMNAPSHDPKLNPDPLTHEPGSHPVGTGIGAVAGGAIAGAAIGTIAGPVGTAVGAAIGAIAGGLAGHAVAETVHPTVEDAEPVKAEMIEGLGEVLLVASVPDAARSADVAAKTVPTAEATQPVDRDLIARNAYQVWEWKGRTEGHAMNDWLEAEAFLKSRN